VSRLAAQAALCILASAAMAAELDPWFGDAMVLQRDRPIRIAGTATPRSTLTVRLGSAQATAAADAEGKWACVFPPRRADAHPVDLMVQEPGQPDYSARGIVIGDVWICAGQSNMEFPLARDAAAKSELPQADLPLVRLRNHAFAGQYRFAAALDAATVARMTAKDFYTGQWEACTAKSAAPMSAVGYYFAKKVSAETGVPIGLVNYAVGGAPIEAFVRREALAADATFRRKVSGNWLDNESIEGTFVRLRGRQHVGSAKDAPGDDLGPNHGFKPGFAWAAGPAKATGFAIKGVLWYQGESNAIRMEDVSEYAALTKLLVADWRERWGQPDLPFLWVQLPAINEPPRRFWPEFREAQRAAAAAITHTSMAVALDVGTPKDVHPRNKAPVGERLALLALRDVYGHPDLIAEGPVATTAHRTAQGVRIRFRAADGLVAVEGLAPALEVRLEGEASFRPVTAWRIEGSDLLVEAKGRVAEVRYAWHMNAAAALTGKGKLPAGPFALRTAE
jgi:sialate O-acetylesterase